MAAILRSWSWPRGSNMTTSSRRLRNSGRKCCLTTPMTRSLARAVLPCSSSRSEPRLEVRMMTVLQRTPCAPWHLSAAHRPARPAGCSIPAHQLQLSAGHADVSIVQNGPQHCLRNTSKECLAGIGQFTHCFSRGMITIPPPGLLHLQGSG